MNTKLVMVILGGMAVLQSTTVLLAQTTLGVALNDTNLVWTTGGTGGVGWTYEAQDIYGGDNTFDGIASARSGQIGDNSETWFQTTVVGPGMVSFWWQAYSEPDADWLQFYINSDLQAQISGVLPNNPSGWEYCAFAVPAGTNVLKWRYVKDYAYTGGTLDCCWVDAVSYVTTPPPPVSQALNTVGVTWTTSGSVYPNGWFSQTNVTHDGQWAAQSGAIWHNQTNWLQTTVVGITNVSFWWKVSSETNTPKTTSGDYLAFYTNGVLAKQICGEVNWQSNFFKLPSKTNVLTWLYRKDDSITEGANCGWLDQVAFSPTPKPSPFTLQTPIRLPDGSIQLIVSGDTGVPCRIDFSTNPTSSTNWTPLTNFTTTSANTAIIDSSAINSSYRCYRAVSQ